MSYYIKGHGIPNPIFVDESVKPKKRNKKGQFSKKINFVWIAPHERMATAYLFFFISLFAVGYLIHSFEAQKVYASEKPKNNYESCLVIKYAKMKVIGTTPKELKEDCKKLGVYL